jgi:hypothetical protein
MTCTGPLIWYDVAAGGALLECARCGYIIVAGSFNDARHAETPLLREGLAA